jgi:myosin heavy subunit
VRLLVHIKTRKIQGATISNYLLEKSRITSQTEGERNYHIFYFFLKGASLDTLKKYGLNEGDSHIPL